MTNTDEMNIKARNAIEKIKGQLDDLESIIKTGELEEKSDKVDRWYERTKKVIDLYISNTEANKFEMVSTIGLMVQTKNQFFLNKIKTYKQKLNVLIQELQTHPENVIDPSKLVVTNENSTQYDFLLNMLHPEILSVSKNEFNDEYYSNSVFSAFKAVNNRVKAHFKNIRAEEIDGKNLMMKAFSDNNPVIEMGDLQTETGRNMQEGYRFIFAGSIQAIRNPKAHDRIEIDKNRAVHFLFLASLEMYKLDEAKVPTDMGG